MRHLVRLSIVLLSVLLPASSSAQGAAPDKVGDQIREGVKSVVDASPEAVTKIEGVLEITYKQVPLDPDAIFQAMRRSFPSGPIPANLDPSRLGPMVAPIIKDLLPEFLQTLGTVKVLQPVKFKRYTIKPGTYTLGLFEAVNAPRILVLTPVDDGSKKKKKSKEWALRLELKRQETPPTALEIELKEPVTKRRKTKRSFSLELTLLDGLAKTEAKLSYKAPRTK